MKWYNENNGNPDELPDNRSNDLRQEPRYDRPSL